MDVVRKAANHGWIEVITGSMFSGKSEELIRRLRRAQIARQKVQIFKPLDRRPLQRRPHRVAQRHADRVGERRDSRASCSTRWSTTPKSSASTKGSSSTPTCRRPATRSPTAASASSSPASIRITSASRSSRCRSCWRSPNTSPRRSRSAWSAATRPTTRSGSSRAAIACWSARSGIYEARCRHCFDPTLAARRRKIRRLEASCRAVASELAGHLPLLDRRILLWRSASVLFVVANVRRSA